MVDDGCQIDLLIQTKRSVYLCEIKFKSQISTSVIQEVDRKIAALKLPKNQSIRTVLIYDGQLAPSIEEDQAFSYPRKRAFCNLGMNFPKAILDRHSRQRRLDLAPSAFIDRKRRP